MMATRRYDHPFVFQALDASPARRWRQPDLPRDLRRGPTGIFLQRVKNASVGFVQLNTIHADLAIKATWLLLKSRDSILYQRRQEIPAR